MAVFDNPHFDDHEHIGFFSDPSTGLRAIVAIHSTGVAKMAGGGCRMWPYATDDEALADVLRLSRAMTFKLALAGLPVGGGKAVILGDPARDKSPDLLRAFGRAIDGLKGRFIVGEDVGTGPDDMERIGEVTPFVTRRVGVGDTSAPTGYGTYTALRTAVRHRLGRDDLDGVTVAVQGVGNVGYELCKCLKADGARLIVTDVSHDRVRMAETELGATSVEPHEIYDVDVEVFAPCAMGSVLNPETIPRLKCSVVAGSANNQLELEDRDSAALQARGILYAPDFVANAGGVMGATPGIGPEDALKATEQIEGILDEVFQRADRDGTSPHAAAVALARERIASW